MKAHKQIAEEGTIERYVRRELGDEERRTFEEHLLDCAECFQEVQIMESFIAGVRHSARTGTLREPAPDRGLRWLAPLLATALALVVILGAMWIGTLRQRLQEADGARDALVHQVAEAKLAAAQPAELTAGNLPIAVLQANRAAGVESVLPVPRGARAAAFWMDVEPGGRYRTFGVAVSAEGGQVIEAVGGLTRNSQGAVAVVLPAAKLPAGRYTVRLSSEAPPRLLAQYTVRVSTE